MRIGILKRAAEAKEQTEKAQKEEEAILSDIETLIENNGESLFDIEAGANRPKLTSGMIPVKYDTEEESWVICSSSDSEWYNYKETDKKWANVMLSDGKYTTETAQVGTKVATNELGSMFVWIPRYAYQIKSGYHESSASGGEIDVKFLIGTTDKSVDNVEIIEYNSTTTSNYTKFPDGYVVHPAFTDNTSSGGWDKRLTGIWVAKFEAGYPMLDDEFDNSTSTVTVNASNLKYPVFKGQKYSYNMITIGNAYLLAQNLYTDTNNPYGLTASSNSHMIKNSEWGAVAYLAQSSYGKNSEVYINNVSFENSSVNGLTGIYAMTGYSADTVNRGTNNVTGVTIGDTMTGASSYTSYAWYVTEPNQITGNGTNASTTGNIYGIYDMSGGCWEYPAAVIPTGHESINSFGGTAFASMTVSSKYATLYPVGNSTQEATDVSRSYSAWGSMYGDAIWETSPNAGPTSLNTAWYNDRSDGDDSSYETFFFRGAYWGNGSDAGTFAFADGSGYANYSCSYRVVLAVE